MANHAASSEARLEALIDAVAPLLGISVERESRAGIIAILRQCFDLADLLLEFPLDERAEPAPVLRP